MGKGRSRWEIILNILNVIKKNKKIKKTRLMQNANLYWRNFKKYFDYLLEKKILASQTRIKIVIHSQKMELNY